jgi:hypothetical protein
MSAVAGFDTEAAIGKFQEGIRAYLDTRPHARDSVEGIAKSWLSLGAVLIPLVQAALDRLVNHGELAQTTLIDGTVIYHLPQSN